MRPLPAVCLLIALPLTLTAQEQGYTSIRWWHPLVATAGVAATFVLDQPVHDYLVNHQSATGTDVADVAKTFHEPEVTLTISGATLAGGLLLHNAEIAQTGVQVLASYGLASGMLIGTKWAFGRARPNHAPNDNTRFDWFNGGTDNSFPSGAAVVTFSLAATLADAIHHPAATVVVYSGAALNAWARVYADRHWFSDVVLGALCGVTAAKLVNGHWRIFGLKPPTAAIDRHGRPMLGFEIDW